MGCSRRGRVPWAHLVARADSNGELGRGEEVQGARTVGDVRGVGLELAAGGAVRVGALGVELVAGVLVDPALEEAELVLRGVQERLPSELTAGFNVTKNA